MRKQTVHDSVLEEQDDAQEEYQTDTMAEEVVEEFIEEVVEEYLEEETVLSEAEARIEQANLYQALLKAQLFTQDSARPEIIDAVSKEFKSFIVSRLETLLGIRPEKQQLAEVVSPFSPEELEALKQLASHMISKKSSQPQAPAAPVKPTPTVTPVTRSAPTQQAAPARVQSVQARPAQPVQKPAPRPAAPVQQQAPPPPQPQAQTEVVNGKKIVRRVVRRVVQGPTQAQAQLPQNAPVTDSRNQNVSIEGVNYAQAVNTLRPPLPMPSQAHIDMMNANTAEANAKGAGTVSGLIGKMVK